MKTSKEMQLKIIDKMRENVEKGIQLFEGIQYRQDNTGLWADDVISVSDRHFEVLEHRLKPETITINGVEIPKPLSRDEFENGDIVFIIGDIDALYFEVLGLYVANHGGKFVYKTKEEAIEASKALFGIKE